MSSRNERRVRRGLERWCRRVATRILVLLAVAFFAFCAAWRIDGGTWERVETPSMGTVAPVGTLLWVKPADFDSLRPGDFISFRPPGATGQTYSHQVLTREADGRITTKGVLSSPDPWRLSATDVVGSVRMSWPGIGWLVAAAPILAAGVLFALGLARCVRPRWRTPLLLVVVAVALSAVITWYRPLVNAEQLAFAPTPEGGADASYVGTGLLPIRLTAHDGPSVVMRAGEVGTVHVGSADDAGKLRISLGPAIPPWWWAALVAACFVPAAGSTVRSSRRRPTPMHALADRSEMHREDSRADAA
jgi:hypothetical protein